MAHRVTDTTSARQESASLRMNRALSRLPSFSAFSGDDNIQAHHCASITMIESPEHLNQAFHSARSGEPADPPIIEAIIPSTMDPDLTEESGHHVMSLLCKYMPYKLNKERSWDVEKSNVVDMILN